MQVTPWTGDVVCWVLKCVVKVSERQKADWAVNLNLLAVCSEWRKVALPLVYSYLWVAYSSDKYGQYDMSTNIGLAADLGHTHLAKHLNIFNVSRYTYPILDPASHMLAYYANVWPNIKTLTITAETAKDRLGAIPNRQRVLHCINQAVKVLTKLLPEVTCLQLFGEFTRLAATTFQQIAKHYKSQVTNMEVVYPSCVGGQHYLQQLTHLDIMFGYPHSNFGLHVGAEHMRHLTLREMPVMFDWSGFSKESNPKVVCLPSLQSLRILSESDSTTNGTCQFILENDLPLDFEPKYSYKIRFPKLEHLELVAQANHYLVLKHGIFENTVEHVHINGSDKSLATLMDVELPSINKLTMTVGAHGLPGLVQALHCIDHVALAARSCEVSLIFRASEVYGVPDGMTSMHITQLEINAPASAKTVQSFIRQMPNLVHLKVAQFVYDESLPTQECVGDTQATPFVSKIESLELNCFPYKRTYTHATMFLQYLMVRLPRLLKIHGKRIESSSMAAFVMQMSGRYPHLAAIDCDFPTELPIPTYV